MNHNEGCPSDYPFYDENTRECRQNITDILSSEMDEQIGTEDSTKKPATETIELEETEDSTQKPATETTELEETEDSTQKPVTETIELEETDLPSEESSNNNNIINWTETQSTQSTQSTQFIQSTILTTQLNILTTQPTILTTKPTILTTQPTILTTQPTILTTQPTILSIQPTILTTQPIITNIFTNYHNSLEIHEEKIDILKDNIINEIPYIIENIEIGQIYKKTGEDYSIFIYPTNSTYLTSTTHVNFTECEVLLREKFQIQV